MLPSKIHTAFFFQSSKHIKIADQRYVRMKYDHYVPDNTEMLLFTSEIKTTQNSLTNLFNKIVRKTCCDTLDEHKEKSSLDGHSFYGHGVVFISVSIAEFTYFFSRVPTNAMCSMG